MSREQFERRVRDCVTAELEVLSYTRIEAISDKLYREDANQKWQCRGSNTEA